MHTDARWCVITWVILLRVHDDSDTHCAACMCSLIHLVWSSAQAYMTPYMWCKSNAQWCRITGVIIALSAWCLQDIVRCTHVHLSAHSWLWCVISVCMHANVHVMQTDATWCAITRVIIALGGWCFQCTLCFMYLQRCAFGPEQHPASMNMHGALHVMQGNAQYCVIAGVIIAPSARCFHYTLCCMYLQHCAFGLEQRPHLQEYAHSLTYDAWRCTMMCDHRSDYSSECIMFLMHPAVHASAALCIWSGAAPSLHRHA